MLSLKTLQLRGGNDFSMENELICASQHPDTRRRQLILDHQVDLERKRREQGPSTTYNSVVCVRPGNVWHEHSIDHIHVHFRQMRNLFNLRSQISKRLRDNRWYNR